MFLIFFNKFFSSESWDVVFFKNKKGGSKGGQPEAVFYIEIYIFSENSENLTNFHIKIPLRVVPLLVPLSDFKKIQHFSFHWKKKIKVIAFLDRILAQFEIQTNIGIFDNFKTYCWKSRFSTVGNIQNCNWAKIRSKKAMTLIFFQRKLRCRIFQIWKRRARGGAMGGSIFL